MSIKQLSMALIALVSLWACANIGNPEGGPYDTQAPRLVKAKPAERATNVQDQRLLLEFDEYVKLVGQDKIIISPPQQKLPLINASGKHVSVRLQDSLRPNTTYSFYFDDAIVDNNEDNPIEDFDYLFSTGGVIDTMRLGGLVLDAETLEPMPNLVVGAYYSTGLTDSTALKEAFSFVGKTSKSGRFVVRGLRDSVYSVFALKDDDNDYRYNGQSEGFAFASTTYRTTKLDSIKTDTIKIDSIVRRDTLHRDSLVTYQHTYYKPNDIVLRYFTAQSRQRGLQRSQRADSLHFTLEFAERLLSAPKIQMLDKANTRGEELYFTTIEDKTATYWLRDKVLIGADSIRFGISYLKTDSLMQVRETTDTITLMKPRVKPEEKVKKKGEQEKTENPFKLTFSGASGVRSSTPSDSLILRASFPIEALTEKQIRLERLQDSTYHPQPYILERDSLDGLRYHLRFERKYATTYRAKIDSAAVHSIYGHISDSIVFEQKVEAEDTFGRLQVRIEGLPAGAKYIAQLLDKSGAKQMDLPLSLLRETPLKADSTKAKPDSLDVKPVIDSLGKAPIYLVEFADLKPDTYYLRLFEDSNADGRWTTGEYPSRQPEAMYYSPDKYEVKKSFTTSEVWKPLSRPLDKQKPEELLKTKPEARKKREDKNKEYYKRLEEKKGKQG